MPTPILPPRVDSLARKVLHGSRRAAAWAITQSWKPALGAPGGVIRAVKVALSRGIDPAEKVWIDRIEKTRQALLASVEPLEIVDFGAGKAADLGPDDTAEVKTTTRTLGQMTLSSQRPRGAYLLFRILRELKPTSVLELGSCVGISGSYLGAALELNGSGQLVTLEGAPVLAERSRRTVADLGLGDRVEVVQGPFAETLGATLARVRPLQFAFVDGHHLESATLDYLERLIGEMDVESVMHFDDINWSDGMRRAWKRIEADPRFALTIDLGSFGAAVLSATPAEPRHLKTRYA